MFWVYRNGSNFPSDVDDVCFQSAGWRAAVWIPGTSARGTSFPTARVCIGVDLQSKDMCGCMWMCIMHVGTCEYMWMCVDAHGQQVCVCGYMRIHVDVYECVWILVDVCGCMWIHMDVCWCVCMHVDTCRYLWIPVDVCGWVWMCVDTCGYM